MITSVDTNILLDFLSLSDLVRRQQAREALRRCVKQGDLVISVIVYAELAPRFSSQDQLDEFLADSNIAVVQISAAALFLAGTLFAAYLRRGGTRERILPDYLVGAHAMMGADQLLTRDGRFYGSTFPSLKAVSPSDVLSSVP